MRKSILLTALMLGGALMSTAQVSLSKQWSLNCPLGASSGRSGVGTHGKFYVIEQNKGVHVYDQTGQVGMIDNTSAWVSVNCDDAGHVYFRNDKGGWAGPAGDGTYTQANAQICVYDAVNGTMVAENVPLKGLGDGNRFDALPHIYGDMTDGAFNFVVPIAWTRTMREVDYPSLNEENTQYYSEAPIAYYDGGLSPSNSTTGITQMYDENHLAVVLNASAGQSYKGSNGNAIGIFEKTAPGQYTFLGYADTPSRSGVAGFHIFDCKGDKYIVYPTGQVSAGQNASADGFAVTKLEIVSTPANTTSTPLVLNYASIELGETYPRYFNVEAMEGENAKYTIYLYSPGKILAVYALDLSSLYPEEDPEYMSWEVAVNGEFNEWNGESVTPNKMGIANFTDLAIGTGEFEISVSDGENETVYGTGTTVAVDEWVELDNTLESKRMTVAGAEDNTIYNISYDVVNNKILISVVEPPEVPNYRMEYKLTTDWRNNMKSTNSGHMRQGVGANGKMYITNTQGGYSAKGWIEVWGPDGFEGKLAEGEVIGTNISVDEAGNILARNSAFPNPFSGDNNFNAIIIDPEGNITPLTFDAARFSTGGSCQTRQDFWGHIQGNMLSDEGGVLTFGTSGGGHIDIKIVNGQHVGGESARDSYWSDADFPHTTTAVFHNYSFMPDMAVYQAGPTEPIKLVRREPTNGTFKWFVRDQFSTPEHNNTVGCALFKLGDEYYLVYSRGGNNADGIVVTKARLVKGDLDVMPKTSDIDSEVVHKSFAETDDAGNTVYNGGQYNHFNVQVADDGQTAHIYQYVPGNFSAMHTFTATKVNTGVENVVVNDSEKDGVESAPVYYNMQGVRVVNPQNGLYIEVRGNKTRKVIIR